MRVLSLFSGIGGFDLGFRRAGMEIVGMCEINKPAQSVLRNQFPEAVLHDDVREVNYAPGTIDVICGGFPCQDVSVAGQRRGFNGERSSLWYEFARIIADTRPAWVIVENVPGLLSSNGGRDFAAVIGNLAQFGYGVGWRILDAQYWGLAQRRKRVFIVASFRTPRACTLLLDGASLRRDYPPRRQSGAGNPGTTTDDITHNGGGVYAIQGNIIDRERGGAGGIGISADGIGYTLTATDRHAVTALLWESAHGYEPARVSKNQHIAPTLSAKMGTGGNNVPLIGVRRLTPLECERLQGFPDDWTAGQSDAQRYRQLGNAVAVPVAQWIGERIIDVEKGV